MRINIDKITVKERIRKEVTKIDELAADIAGNGLLNPVTVMAADGKDGREFQLLAGLRRLKAVQSLGWEEIPVNIVTPANAEQTLRMEIAENEQREPFTTTERVHFGALLEEIESAKAKVNQLSGKSLDDLCPERGKGQKPDGKAGRVWTDAVVAPKVGMSRAQYQRAKYVVKNGTPEVVGKVDSGEQSITSAYNEVRDNACEKKPKDVPLRDKPAEPVKYAAPLKIVSEEECAAVGNETEAEPEAAQPVEQAPKELPPEKPKRQTAAQKREEKELACLSPKDRAAVEQRRAFDAMTDKEKIVDLEKRLSDERFRADTAEAELAREKELHKNTIYHRDGTITNQRGQIERLTKALDEVCAERDELKDKVAELEKAVDNSVVNDSNNTTIHF